jgi:hypothetical protein
VAFFDSAADFRSWLEENGDKVASLWLGFYNKVLGFRDPMPVFKQSLNIHNSAARRRV